MVVGGAGWIGVAALWLVLLSRRPPEAGFDLQLVLDAARRVVAGDPLYVGLLAPQSAGLRAVDLFYAYPPVVAQIFAPLAWLPSSIVLAIVGGVAVVGTVLSIARIASPAEVRSASIAVLPYVFPFTIALLFGNLDMFYPLVVGLLVLLAVAPSTGRLAAAAGVALGLASVAKIHPASLALWAVTRASAPPRHIRWRAVAFSAGFVAIVLVSLSILVGGPKPWADYVAVTRTLSGVDAVVSRNLAPAAQLALALGLGEPGARTLYLAVAAVAVVGTAVAGWRLADELLSLAIAVVLSLVILPVTWYHYAAALIPLAVAALSRARGTQAWRATLAAAAIAFAVAFLSVAAPVWIWMAIAAVVRAVALSGRVDAARHVAPTSSMP